MVQMYLARISYNINSKVIKIENYNTGLSFLFYASSGHESVKYVIFTYIGKKYLRNEAD